MTTKIDSGGTDIGSAGPGTRSCSGAATYALLALLLVAVAAPLVAMLIRAVTGYNGDPSALGQLAEPANLRIVGNTVLLGVLVVVISTAMAAPLAFLMSWTRLRRHRWIDIAVMVPFLTPPYVAAMAWLDFTRINGLGERWLGPSGGALVRSVVESPVGMAAIMACEIFTFLYLLLRNRLDAVPASLDEMAAVAGASAGQRFRLVLAPLLSPTYALGALIVFIRAAGEFGTPVTLGNRIGFPVLVSEIYGNVTIDPLNFPRAAAFSTVLLTMGMTVWGLQQWMSRREVPFGGRVARRTRVDTGWWTVPGWLWIGLVLLISVLVPYISIILGAMTVLRSKPPSMNNLTFDYFARVLRPGRGLDALQNSIILSLLAATVATVLAVVCAMVIARRRGVETRARSTARRGIDLLGIAPDTVPTIVLVIGFIFLWNAPWLPFTPYNTRAMVVLAYVVITLPVVLQNVKVAYAAVDDKFLEAAAACGATAWQTLWRITIPLLMPGIVAGWLLAFLLGVREVVASSMVRPASLQLLSPWILGQFDQGHRAEAMAMTVIGVLGSTVVLVLLEWWRNRMSEKRSR
ncbi:MAG: iron transporter permease [Nocardia sp.]|uniref:ABC transporter permease n=1 Tax=Nocardia sp. TaxID=1821 RepID=UPI0026167602|nr:iron ABC transporter permease [Nocardia sp.]MCU1642237.1 iron transporter permease [Nocardia sp.]